jgi:hypothetical protein
MRSKQNIHYLDCPGRDAAIVIRSLSTPITASLTALQHMQEEAIGDTGKEPEDTRDYPKQPPPTIETA